MKPGNPGVARTPERVDAGISSSRPREGAPAGGAQMIEHVTPRLHGTMTSTDPGAASTPVRAAPGFLAVRGPRPALTALDTAGDQAPPSPVGSGVPATVGSCPMPFAPAPSVLSSRPW